MFYSAAQSTVMLRWCRILYAEDNTQYAILWSCRTWCLRHSADFGASQGWSSPDLSMQYLSNYWHWLVKSGQNWPCWLDWVSMHSNLTKASAKSKIVLPKWIPLTDPSPYSPQIIQASSLQSSTMLQGVQWCDCVVTTFQKLALSWKLSYYSWIIQVDPVDFDCFDDLLNCSIDFTNILNYLIPSDIHYTPACTTPRTKIQSKHSSDYYTSLQQWLQALNQITYM